MKNKILSLILVFMLLPIASLFVACGKDGGYNLNNLKTDYTKIDEENDNITIQDYKISFVYSTNINNVTTSTEPYTALNNYNYVFNNLMCFANNYIEVCSNNKNIENVAIKNDINNSLNEFKSAVKAVDTNIELFDEIIEVAISNSENVAESNVCLNRFKNLLISYNELFRTASNFNNNLYKLYFNEILNDSNPNITNIELNDFDASAVINKLRSKIYYQITLLTENYIEMYIDGGETAEKITNKQITFDLNQYNYKTNIEAINKDFVENTAIEVANNAANKANFYYVAVQAYNLQEILFNDLNKFIEAMNKISYTTTVESLTATAYENLCADIIENNLMLITEYNSIFVQMLALMGV